MTSLLCVCFAVVMLLGCSGEYSYVQISNGKVSEKSARPEIIELDVKGDNEGQCTGTFVATNLVLTAAHCAALGTVSYRGYESQLEIISEEWRKKQVVGNFDLALVVFKDQIANPDQVVSLGSRPPRVGERIWIAGFGNNDLIRQTGAGVLREGANVVDAINNHWIEISGVSSPKSENVPLGEDSHSGKGDSGGPMYIAEAVGGEWKRRQVGVCSGGDANRSYYINLLSPIVNSWLCTAQATAGTKVTGLDCK